MSWRNKLRLKSFSRGSEPSEVRSENPKVLPLRDSLGRQGAEEGWSLTLAAELGKFLEPRFKNGNLKVDSLSRRPLPMPQPVLVLMGLQVGGIKVEVTSNDQL